MAILSEGLPYKIENRELVAQSDGLRVQVLTLGPGHCVPWHKHTQIVDTFFCLEGPMLIRTREPESANRLLAGERFQVPVGQPHYVCAEGDGRCSFAIVQGVGKYDFVPLSDVNEQG